MADIRSCQNYHHDNCHMGSCESFQTPEMRISTPSSSRTILGVGDDDVHNFTRRERLCLYYQLIEGEVGRCEKPTQRVYLLLELMQV